MRRQILSVLGIDEVHRRVREDNLITGLSPRELENPEGVGLDLRLGEVHEITEGGAFIEADGKEGLGLRKGVQAKQLGVWQDGSGESVEIEPGQFVPVRATTFDQQGGSWL